MDQPDNPSGARRKRIEVAIRVSEAFKAAGYRAVQYGGATVEFYTAGRYATGDVDIGFLGRAPSIEAKERIMRDLGSSGNIRLFVLDGVVVDLGGEAELYSSKIVELQTPQGSIFLEAAEEEIAQRLLMGVYPQPDPVQYHAARLLVGQALEGALEVDWNEVLRLARLPGFRVEKELRQLVEECAALLGVAKPSGF